MVKKNGIIKANYSIIEEYDNKDDGKSIVEIIITIFVILTIVIILFLIVKCMIYKKCGKSSNSFFHMFDLKLTI